ncbi:chromosome segregation in meiosis- protein [Ascosphaera atra]|nr:chromosome segregation in meiosis- protein [Ascosphaera atra]
MGDQARNEDSNAVDDLFDYDLDFEDIIRDQQGQDQANNANGRDGGAGDRQGGGDADAGLGLDEEIKVTRKRRPIPKLDEDRLLSQAGIPKLRNKSRKLNLKGKDHEYSDTMRLLNLYQLWLDDLYPRAKFADGLAIIEKLGHSKRMQVMRKEWIYESQRKRRDRDDDDLFDATPNGEPSGETQTGDNQPTTQGRDDRRPEPTAFDNDGDLFVDEDATAKASRGLVPANDDEDDLDTLLAEQEARQPAKSDTARGVPASEDVDMPLAQQDQSRRQPQESSQRGNDVPEDDLDALLAEQEIITDTKKIEPTREEKGKQKAMEDDFDDDWEAMNDVGL